MRLFLLALILLSQACLQEPNKFHHVQEESNFRPNFSLGSSTLKSFDPCFKLLSEPSKALEDHLKSLSRQEVAQHYFEGLLSGGHGEKIIHSKDIDYLKWFIITMSYFDGINIPEKDKYLNYFMSLNVMLMDDKFARKFLKGESFSDSGITFEEYKRALNKLENVENNFKEMLKISNNKDIISGIKLTKEMVLFTFFELLFSEEKNLTKFSLDFLAWSKQEWFKAHFSQVIEILKKYSLGLKFTKEKFLNLEKRLEAPKRIVKDYAEKKMIDKSGLIGQRINLLYNNIGFESGALRPEGKNKILGKKLEINEIKTGYNIYFPHKFTDKSALIIHVYGGFGVDVNNSDFLPSNLSLLMYKFLDNNMVVAELNLPDRLKLRVPQSAMNKELHDEIHESINNFFEVVSSEPEVLLPDNFRGKMATQVRQLKNMPKYIFGSSFGGRTAVRHLQLYPNTLDGAISHSGGLLRHSTNTYLWPSYFIKDIKQKVLLLHNMDDARVSVHESINFFSTSLKAGKNMQLYLNPQGNPATLRRGLVELSLKGHFIPTRQDYFDSYGQRILDFIEGNPYPDMDKQNRVLMRLQAAKHLKTNHSDVWYVLKEIIFHRVKDINKRHEIRSYIDDLAMNK